ncbi:MAG: hypothetical protein JXB36_16065, partial [Gammaproteobacteria bacterium]|nr:hypothetical protein [Gammaproteobacteria bacterium]
IAMRHPPFVVNLPSSAAVVALIALLYGVSSRAQPLDDRHVVLERLTEDVTREVRATYALLFEHLGLTPLEKDALFELLAEDELARTWLDDKAPLGNPMDEHERSSRIAAIIGDAKLHEFSALERNAPSYWEVGVIGALLERNGVPLTAAQRDGLFEILMDVRDRVSPSPAGKILSIESLERAVTQINEYQRHVVELAPSVLSPEQVVYLHGRYQDMSYRRFQDIERKRQEAADGTLDVDTVPSILVWSE